MAALATLLAHAILGSIVYKFLYTL